MNTPDPYDPNDLPSYIARNYGGHPFDSYGERLLAGVIREALSVQRVEAREEIDRLRQALRTLGVSI